MVDRQRAVQLLLEGLMVLLGVSIALFADEWREERQLAEEAEAARLLLEEEVVMNYDQIVDFGHDVRDRHARLRALAGALAPGSSFDQYSNCFIGYRFTLTRDAAWLRASRDRIGSRLPGSYMDAVAGLYAWNRTLEEHSDIINGILYSSDYFDPAAAESVLRLAERAVWQQQRWASVMRDAYRGFAQEHAPQLLARMDGIDAEAEARWPGVIEERDAARADEARYQRCRPAG